MYFLNNAVMIYPLNQHHKMSDNLIDHVDHQIKITQSEQIANFHDETR